MCSANYTVFLFPSDWCLVLREKITLQRSTISQSQTVLLCTRKKPRKWLSGFQKKHFVLQKARKVTTHNKNWCAEFEKVKILFSEKKICVLINKTRCTNEIKNCE